MKLEPAPPAEFLAEVRTVFQAAGVAFVATAVAEPLSLYLDLAGEALRERLFLVQGADREEYCLRPDFTLGTALAHIAAGAATGRYLYEGPAFRVAPPGSDRPEQFLQIGLEAYEAGDAPLADAAMASLAWRAAKAGGRDDLGLIVGDVSLFGVFLTSLGIPALVAAHLRAAFSRPWRLARALDAATQDGRGSPAGPLASLLKDLDESRAASALEEVWALAGIEPVGGRSAAEIVSRLTSREADSTAPKLPPGQRAMIDRYLSIEGEPLAALDAVSGLAPHDKPLELALAAWRRRVAALSDIPAGRVRFSTAFARGFGYYDGFLFEVRSQALGEDEPVAAGGRYDSLPGRLGAPLATGAVGCMVRPGRAWRGGST
jgi:ATP phosphoribosyltransferase regulatory subunit